MVGVAVNVTLVPEHMAPAGFAAMLTLAGCAELTDIVMPFDVTGLPVAHVTVLVSTQVIISPLAKVEEVYVVVVAPEIFVPFFFH